MGNSSSVYENVTVENDSLIKRRYVNGELVSTISVGVIEKTKVFFSDIEWKDIKEVGYKDIDFCLLDNNTNGVSECMGLFDYSDNDRGAVLDQYAVTKGPTSCKGYFYRPGMVYFNNSDFEYIKNEFGPPENGKLCRIVYQDYNYNDKDMDRCCFSNNKEKCNANLINGYTTSHCNAVMKKRCKGDESNPKCILWLENNLKREDDMSLEFYQEYCSENFDKQVCNYFCKVSRYNQDFKSSYCDAALTSYCKKNQFNSNCFCVITPTMFVPELETYLGPKECWLSPCSSQKDSKWLLTTQIDTRQKCNLTTCIITIDELTLKNKSKAELINDCVSGTTVNSYYQLESEKPKQEIIIDQTPGVLFYPNLGLLALALILLLK